MFTFSNKSELMDIPDLKLNVFLVGLSVVLFSTPSPPGRLYSASNLSAENPKKFLPSLYVRPIPPVKFCLAELL